MTRKSFRFIPVFWLVLFVPALLFAAAPSPETAVPTLALTNYYPNLTFNHPVDIANAGDNRLFIVEQDGIIRLANLSSSETSTQTFLDITSRVESTCPECGLLGLVFHPEYANNGRFYINYTHTNGTQLVTRISQFTITTPSTADPNSETILLEIDQPHPNHNAGDLAFGPDGYLYVGLGDGGSGGDPHDHGQNPATLLGTMLRLDVNGTGRPPECAPNGSYTIPASNPFVADNDAKCDEIWAVGLRNPWRFSFDSQTGDLFIGDVGQNLWEEVNFQPASSSGGENYGWNCYEGTHLYTGGNSNPNSCQPASSYTMPIFEQPHGSANSITGGFVYRGWLYPALTGHYVVADFSTGNVWTLQQNSGSWTAAAHGKLSGLNNPSTFGEDVNGELYAADYGSGKIYQIQETTVFPAELTITKTAPAAVFGSDNITYTLTVMNLGTETAVNLTIQDTLPAASTYVTSSGGGTPSNGIVSWQIPTLAGRTSTAVTLTVTPGQPVTTNTTYSVTADGGLAANGTAVTTLLNPNQIYLPAIFN